jgi:hypothetical protein
VIQKKRQRELQRRDRRSHKEGTEGATKKTEGVTTKRQKESQRRDRRSH